ncbi:MAG: hypothetical protein RL681_275 [Candidatus Parcubacteria bacterium]|jgi:mannose-6-phosphate isomerase-like protein (cupin superfamily)
MDEQEVIEGLENEGFGEVITHDDFSETTYSDRTHEKKSVHVIVRGSMTLVVQGKTTELGIGDRLDVPAGAVHSITIGPEGCRYVFAE